MADIRLTDDNEVSRLEITLELVQGGTKVSSLDTRIPKGQGRNQSQGWKNCCFVPMKKGSP
jgi:hypothetical protein